MEEKYLPIGTIILLKGATKKLMIAGYCPQTDKEEFDYSGCIWPEGILSSDQTPLFNHNQIEKIVSLGFIDDEQKQFISNLKIAVSKLKQDNNSNDSLNIDV